MGDALKKIKLFKKELLILLSTVWALIFFASIIGFDQKDILILNGVDNGVINNWLGAFGVRISNFIFQIFGKASYFLALVFVLLPPFLLFGVEFLKKNKLSLALGIGFFTWGLSIFVSLLLNRTGLGGGGFMGGFFAKTLYKISGLMGGYGVALVLMAYGISKATGAFSLKKVFKSTFSKAKEVKDMASAKSSIFIKKQTQEGDFPAFIEKKKEDVSTFIDTDTDVLTENEKTAEDEHHQIPNAAFRIENIDENNSEPLTVEADVFPPEDEAAADEEDDINITEERIILFSKEEDASELFEDVSFIKEKMVSLIEAGTKEEGVAAVAKANTLHAAYEDMVNKASFTNEKAGESFINRKDGPSYTPSIEMLDDNTEVPCFDEEYEDADDVELKEQSFDFVQEDKEKRGELSDLEEASSAKRDAVYRSSSKLITDLPNPFTGYERPPMDILFHSKEVNLEDYKEELEQTASKIIETFREFKISLTKLIACYRGPVITRYEFEIAPGIRMEKIERFSNNIAYSLAAKKVRIIAPIFGKQAIGVEVPNKKRKNVHLGDILKTETFKENSKNNLPIALGKDISGEPLIADLSTMPHLLIAGTTGSGKSVCINSILCSLLYNNRPEELRFLLIDPKRVELKTYDNIPHLLAPVITDAKKASMALNWAVNEMERRYELLEESGSRDIKTYNEKFDKNELNPIVNEGRLHYIVIIIDEMADLMLVAKKEIENVVARLAAKARAAGIHLIFATQSPRADIITGVIKANFQPRIAFAVATKMESRIILDVGGADKLLGKGDMLFYQPGFVEEGTPVRLQGAFISDKEVLKLTTYLSTSCEPEYVDDMFYEEDGEYGLNTMSESDEPIYREAVKIVVSDKKASASYLQRRMQIGYNRAARMIEYMEQEGIVGKANGSKPRDVLVDEYPY